MRRSAFTAVLAGTLIILRRGGVWSQTTSLAPGVELLAPADAARSGASEAPPGSARRRRAVKLQTRKLDQIGPLPQRARLSLFDELRLEVILERRRPLPSGGVAWSGHVAGHEHSRLTLVITEGAVAGAVHAGPAGFFDLWPAADGASMVRQRDPSAIVKCGGVPAPRAAARGAFPASAPPLRFPPARAANQADASPPVMGCDDGSIIDVMVLYSQAARSAAGGTAAMHALIDLAVAETNDAFERSLVTTRLRLVHRQEVAYTETNDVELDSDRLIDPNDGYLDEMHPLRDLYGADCVSLWLDSYGGAGFGYFPHPSLKGVEASGITLMG